MGFYGNIEIYHLGGFCMLAIKGLYKDGKNSAITDIDINIEKGRTVSIECGNDISDLLLKLILGKEIPSKGEILMDNINNLDYVKTNMSMMGVVFREEFFYENITVDRYMRFFFNILCYNGDYRSILLKFALLDNSSTKIKKLTYSQKRRLAFARECLKRPKLLIFQEPIINMDKDSAKIVIENIEELRANGTAVLITSVFFKDAILLGEKAYRLSEDGLIELNNNKQECNNNIVEEKDAEPVYKVEKISARLDERILLFDPTEIDYIESEQGVSNLYVRGEKFPSNLSLNELEERLSCFGFFRCHRSYLVNLQRVREVITWTRNSYSLSLEDKVKSSVPLSKGRLEELKAILKL